MALSSHPITLMLGDECVCEDGYVEWVYRVAHQCMYGVTGQLSFVLGCTSIGFWAVTQVRSARRKSGMIPRVRNPHRGWRPCGTTRGGERRNSSSSSVFSSDVVRT